MRCHAVIDFDGNVPWLWRSKANRRFAAGTLSPTPVPPLHIVVALVPTSNNRVWSTDDGTHWHGSPEVVDLRELIFQIKEAPQLVASFGAGPAR